MLKPLLGLGGINKESWGSVDGGWDRRDLAGLLLCSIAGLVAILLSSCCLHAAPA